MYYLKKKKKMQTFLVFIWFDFIQQSKYMYNR